MSVLYFRLIDNSVSLSWIVFPRRFRSALLSKKSPFLVLFWYEVLSKVWNLFIFRFLFSAKAYLTLAPGKKVITMSNGRLICVPNNEIFSIFFLSISTLAFCFTFLLSLLSCYSCLPISMVVAILPGLDIDWLGLLIFQPSCAPYMYLKSSPHLTGLFRFTTFRFSLTNWMSLDVNFLCSCSLYSVFGIYALFCLKFGKITVGSWSVLMCIAYWSNCFPWLCWFWFKISVIDFYIM